MRCVFLLVVTVSILGCGSVPDTEGGARLLAAAEPRAPLTLDAGLLRTEVFVLDQSGQWRSSQQVLDLGSALPLTLTSKMLVAAQPGRGPHGPTHRFRNARGDTLESRSTRIAGVRFAGRLWVDSLAAEAVWHEDYAPPLRFGVVGWPLLAQERITVDLAAGVLTLAPSQATCHGTPIVVDGRGVVVSVDVDGERIDAILDTAATATITTDKRLARAKSVRMGDRVVNVGPIHHLDLPGLPAPLLIGVPFFAAHRVTIDLPGECLVVHAK